MRQLGFLIESFRKSFRVFLLAVVCIAPLPLIIDQVPTALAENACDKKVEKHPDGSWTEITICTNPNAFTDCQGKQLGDVVSLETAEYGALKNMGKAAFKDLEKGDVQEITITKTEYELVKSCDAQCDDCAPGEANGVRTHKYYAERVVSNKTTLELRVVHNLWRQSAREYQEERLTTGRSAIESNEYVASDPCTGKDGLIVWRSHEYEYQSSDVSQHDWLWDNSWLRNPPVNNTTKMDPPNRSRSEKSWDPWHTDFTEEIECITPTPTPSSSSSDDSSSVSSSDGSSSSSSSVVCDPNSCETYNPDTNKCDTCPDSLECFDQACWPPCAHDQCQARSMTTHACENICGAGEICRGGTCDTNFCNADNCETYNPDTNKCDTCPDSLECFDQACWPPCAHDQCQARSMTTHACENICGAGEICDGGTCV